MRILYVITGLGLGGAEMQVCTLADNLVSKGHEVSIFYLYGKKEVAPHNKNIEVIYGGLTKSPISLLCAFSRMRATLKKVKPDVVHSHMVHANIFSRLARLLVSMKRLVCTSHSSVDGGRVFMFLYRITDPLCDVFTAVGSKAVDNLIGNKATKKGKVISFPNGIDSDKFLANDKTFEPKEARKFIAVGRNHPAKDYDCMLEAIRLVDSEYEFHVTIVGNGTEDLAEKAKKLGIQSKVNLLGPRQDVPSLLQSHDVLLMSSVREGLPMVILEAMASGLNIVTTDAGSCSELLSEFEQTVPVASPALLALEIQRKIDLSFQEFTNISKSNRERAIKCFSIDTISKRLLDVYSV